MKMFARNLNCFALLAALLLSSCGYVSDTPVANSNVYKPGELQSCKIDINKLGEIFKADQKEQIRCLQENFLQFTKYVRSKNPTSVSEGEINAFIRKFFEGQSDSIVKGLGLIFQLNMLLLRDEADRISRTNISPLFDLLVHVNQEAIIITQVLKEMDDEKNQGRFWELRNRFNESINRFSKFTLEIIKKSPGLQQKLNIKEFIIDASKRLGNKEINPETIDSLIFLKRVLVAGDKEVITSDELSKIIENLPRILLLGFDIYFVKSTNFANDNEESRFYLVDLKEFIKIINFEQYDFSLVSVDQLLQLAQDIVKNANVKKFKPSIIALKSKLIGGDKESFSLKDLRTILDIAQDLNERIYFTNVTYNAYRKTLESNKPIVFLPQLNQPIDYDIFSNRRVTELHNDFLDIAVNIKYFRSKKDGISTYGNEIFRNKYGFLEASIIKWISFKLLKGYGHKNSLGQPQVSLAEFSTFLNDLKPILEEFKLWSPKPDTFARNSVLLGDLFQNKSNGDFELNVIEASEFVQMILTAVNVAENFKQELSAVCNSGINKDEPLFATECYNKYFFDLLLNKLEYKNYLPRLNDYFTSAPKEELDDYLKGVQGFARDINDPKLPINKRDSTLTVGAMLNIESTFLRFDSNQDNIIDYNELVEAFKIYKPAIISLANLKPSQEGYAQSIFLYMVSKMEIPPTGNWIDNVKFGSFHKCLSWSFCRNTIIGKIEAKRLNIGKLLYYMVNQNPIKAAALKNENNSVWPRSPMNE